MKKCEVCKSRILFGATVRDGHYFCRRRCMLVRYPLRFCERCLAETTADGTGSLGTFNGTGTTLRNKAGVPPCPDCGSHVARVWYKLMFIPVIPLKWYRVQWIENGMAGGEFLARRLLDEAVPGRHRSRNEPRSGGKGETDD